MSSFFLIPTITAPMPAAAAAIQAYTLASMLSPVCGALPLSVEELLVDELSADEPSAGADGSVTVLLSSCTVSALIALTTAVFASSNALEHHGSWSISESGPHTAHLFGLRPLLSRLAETCRAESGTKCIA